MHIHIYIYINIHTYIHIYVYVNAQLNLECELSYCTTFSDRPIWDVESICDQAPLLALLLHLLLCNRKTVNPLIQKATDKHVCLYNMSA